MPTTTVDFLRAVLPNEGWYCAFILPDKFHFWTKDIDELAEEILRQDALGKTVYHACASYRSRGKRTRSNVLSLRSLWLDIDAGAGKPYADALSAWNAVGLFRKSIGLPRPLAVGSGNGLHIYWPFDAGLSVERWLPLAERLKELCVHEGLSAGPERTADAASILRPAGAHHRKGEARLVQCDRLVGPYSLDQFACLVRGGLHHHGGARPREHTPRKRTLTDAAQHIADFLPSDGNQVADQCRQLGNMRATRGAISEPEWKACINTLYFITKGRALVHEWSTGDERYSVDETNSKFDRASELTGPTTCTHFNSLNKICNGCPHQGFIVSPVELGRGSPKLAKEQIKVAFEFAAKKDERLINVGEFRHQDNGQLVHVSEENGRPINTILTAYPVYIKSVNRGEMRVDQFSVVLSHKPPHEDWTDVEISLKNLFGNSGISEVMGKGIIVHYPDLFKKFIRESIDMLQAKAKTMVQYEQFGWKDDETSFLVGRRLYEPARVVEVVGSPEIVKRARELGPTVRGSLEAWKEAADQLFAVGVEAQGFALLSSFAAPLMRFNAHDEGGAIVSLHSAESGKGKSTALAAAASVWGGHLGLKMTNTDTKVAKGITLGVLGSLPVIFDELNNRDPEEVREFAQIFTTGRDKLRGTSDGQLQHAANSWQTIMLTGSNLSLVDTLNSARAGEAMGMRVIEFSASLPKTVQHWQGDSLKDQLIANAGHAGDAYIRALVQPETLAYVKQSMPGIRDQIIKKYRFASEHRFWVRTLASVSIAAVIVKHLGLLSFSPDRIVQWALENLTNRQVMHAGEVYEGSHMLSRFLSEALPATLIVDKAYKAGSACMARKEPVRDLTVRYELDSGRIYIEKRELRSYMTKQGVSWQDLLNELQFKGILIDANKLATLGAGTHHSHGQTPCVVISSQHPEMTGVVEDVEKVVQMAGVKR